jgi:hypothetical protein
MKKEHNNVWCEEYADRVFPKRAGNCSRCGAILHQLTVDEAIQLIERFEEIALKRTKAGEWNASDWLFDDEAVTLSIARKTLGLGGQLID